MPFSTVSTSSTTSSLASSAGFFDRISPCCSSSPLTPSFSSVVSAGGLPRSPFDFLLLRRVKIPPKMGFFFFAAGCGLVSSSPGRSAWALLESFLASSGCSPSEASTLVSSFSSALSPGTGSSWTSWDTASPSFASVLSTSISSSLCATVASLISWPPPSFSVAALTWVSWSTSALLGSSTSALAPLSDGSVSFFTASATSFWATGVDSGGLCWLSFSASWTLALHLCGLSGPPLGFLFRPNRESMTDLVFDGESCGLPPSLCFCWVLGELKK